MVQEDVRFMLPKVIRQAMAADRRARPRAAVALRTLVISDLHLGANGRVDVLRRDRERAALVARLAEFDRLVLLGDTVELRHGPTRDALADAAPVLRELGSGRRGGGRRARQPRSRAAPRLA